MVDRPNAQGNVTVKDIEGKWVQVGTVVAWLKESDCGGVITLGIERLAGVGVLEGDVKEVKVNFRVWKGK